MSSVFNIFCGTTFSSIFHFFKKQYQCLHELTKHYPSATVEEKFNISSIEELRKTYRGWMEESLEKWGRERQPRWTESIAVGDEGFVGDVKGKLGIRAMGREVIGANGSYELREPKTSYEAVFRPENGDLRDENTFYWDDTF